MNATRGGANRGELTYTSPRFIQTYSFILSAGSVRSFIHSWVHSMELEVARAERRRDKADERFMLYYFAFVSVCVYFPS